MVSDIPVEHDTALEAETLGVLAQLGFQRPAADDVGRDVLAGGERVEQRADTLAGDEMSQEDDAASAEAVRRRRRNAIDPGAHRHDVRSRSLGRKVVAPVPRLARCLRELDARIGTPATKAVDAVVDPCRQRPASEAVRNEVDRPQHDAARPASASRDKATRARERVEAEPCVDLRREQRHEWIEHERGGRLER